MSNRFSAIISALFEFYKMEKNIGHIFFSQPYTNSICAFDIKFEIYINDTICKILT